MKTIGLIVFVIVLCLISVICLFYPDRVQKIAIRSISKGYLTQNTSLESFVRSDKYLNIVRAVGFIAVLCSCFLAWAFFRNRS
jgi:hypothetical protein